MMIRLLSAVLVVVTIFNFSTVKSEPASYSVCNETGVEIKGEILEVDITGCDNFERCPLLAGSSVNFTLKFKALTPSDADLGIERVIVAKFPTLVRGSNLEIPYGGSVIANQVTRGEGSGKTVEEEGKKVTAGETYIHTSVFPVLSSAPKSNLTVRYIIREKVRGSRRRVDWKNHSGKIFTCVEIPVELKNNNPDIEMDPVPGSADP